MIKKLYFSFLLIFLAHCTTRVHVSDAEVSTPIGLKKIAGNYAAYIQTGGWVIKSNQKGSTCLSQAFEIDLNPSYKKAMQKLLESSLEKVTFFERILTKEELNAKGLTAQVSILQGSAEAGFVIHPGFFTSTVETTMDLNAIVSSFGSSGLQFQKEFKINGRGSDDSFSGGGEKSSQLAAQSAIAQLTEIGSLYIREGLRSVSEKV
jgi:hypothetical protein